MVFDAMPLWLSGALVVLIPTVAAMLLTLYVRRRVGLERLSSNNEVAGFKFATVGVVYAVMLAFAVIVVWEKFTDAEEHVAAEAASAATLYRLAAGMDNEQANELRRRLTEYLESAVRDDWPAMARGHGSPKTTQTLSDLYATTLTYKPMDYRGAMLLQETLRQLNALTEARRDRIVKSGGAVPNVLWVVLFAGALVTVAFTLFFGTRNVRAQCLMTGALAALLFAGLLVIVTIDQPFVGAVKLNPDALEDVLAELGRKAVP